MNPTISPHQAQLSFSVGDSRPQLSPTIRLNQQQIDFFHHNGFLHVDELAPKLEIDELRRQYDEWFINRTGRQDGNFFDLVGEDDDPDHQITPQMLWPSQYGYPLYNTQLYANSFTISQQLLGDECVFKGDHAICKPASIHSVSTPWHQDEVYWNESIAYEALGVWIALQPVNVANGCMQFLAGSHRVSNIPLSHHTLDHNPRIHGLEVDDEELRKIADLYSVSIPLNSGGATFHHCRTLHYTGPNRCSSPRRAYTLSFQGHTQPASPIRDYSWNKNKDTNRAKRQAESGWSGREP